MMMQHSEIQNHVRFKKLLEDQNPSAVAIYASFTTSKNSSQFNRAVNQLFSSKTRTAAAAAVPTHASVYNTNNDSVVCNALWKTGKCRYGSSCRFSHQLSPAPLASEGVQVQGRGSKVVNVKPPNGIHKGVRRAGPTSVKTSNESVDVVDRSGPSDDKTAGASDTQSSPTESEIASTTSSQPSSEYDPLTILGTAPGEGTEEAEDRVNSMLASKLLSSLTMGSSTSNSSDRPVHSRFMGLFSRGIGNAAGVDPTASSPLSEGLHLLQPSVGCSIDDGDQWLRDLALIGAPVTAAAVVVGDADDKLISPSAPASALVAHPQLHALPPPGLVVQRSSVEPTPITVVMPTDSFMFTNCRIPLQIQPPTLSTASQPPTLSTSHQMSDDSSDPTASGRSSQSTESPSFRVSCPSTSTITQQQQQQQRSRALLSLLKSGKEVGPFKPASKSVDTKNDHPSSTSPPVDATAEQPIGDTEVPPDQGDRIDKQPITAPVAKKAPLFRITKFQIGAMQIIVNGVYRVHQIMRPTTNMIVRWQLHQVDYESMVAASGGTDHIVIGLVRYGSYTNSPCIVAKPIDRAPRLFRDECLYKGQIVFHAPKSAGQFVYRMFDQSGKEAALNTLASSPPFSVELMGDEDVSTNLMHVLTAFDDGDNKLKGLSQLPSVLRGIRGGGGNMRDPRGAGSFSSRSANYLNECVSIVLSAIHDTSSAIDAWTSAKLKLKAMEKEESGVDCSIASPDLLPPPSGKEIDALRASSKHALKVQAEVHECLLAVMQSNASWYLLSEQQKIVTKAMQALYCPHLQRYFRSIDHMQRARKQEWGFSPAIDSAQSLHDSRGGTSWILINQSIEQLLPSLLPSDSFALVRITAVAQLQRALLSERVIAPGTEIAMYGSSCNNFGSEGADMDLTLLFPKGVDDVANEDKPAMIERLSEALGRIGMLEIKTRSTARIPIVQFRDPTHSLACDISISNQLAVANTRLLRTYGNIDIRVRGLVFLVKHWAKRRHLNSPSDGTLSSYGFIICILHFLQV